MNLWTINANIFEVLLIIVITAVMSSLFYFLIRKQLVDRYQEDAYKIKIRTLKEDTLSIEKKKNSALERKNKEYLGQIKILNETLKEKSNSEFLKNTVQERSYTKKIEECIKNAKSDIKIINPYWTNELVKDIMDKCDASCIVRIITTPPEKSGSGGGRFHEPAVESLKAKLQKNLKINNLIHSRIIIVDNHEMICGSADLHSNSLGGDKIEGGIWTRDPIVVKEAGLFFEAIWQSK